MQQGQQPDCQVNSFQQEVCFDKHQAGKEEASQHLCEQLLYKGSSHMPFLNPHSNPPKEVLLVPYVTGENSEALRGDTVRFGQSLH